MSTASMESTVREGFDASGRSGSHNSRFVEHPSQGGESQLLKPLHPTPLSNLLEMQELQGFVNNALTSAPCTHVVISQDSNQR